MSVLNSEFLSDSIREIVPEVAKVSKELSASSVLTGRRRVRLIAQNGQSFTSTSTGGAQTVNFMLQDGGAFLDPTSCVLSFDLTTWNNTNPSDVSDAVKVCVDDGAWSVFQRMLVSVNSTLMDDIDQVGKKVNTQIYPVVSKSWYDSVGSFMGLWKFSGSAYQGTATTKYDVANRLSAMSSCTQPVAGTVLPAGAKNHFMIPLSLLSGFFANEQLLPLPHMGQLIVQLNLASALEACVASAPGVLPAYRIDNLTMEADFVEVHPTYGALIARLAREDEGLMMPFDAHLVSSQDIGASAGAVTQNNIVFSKATQNLRAITTFQQSKAGLSSSAYPKNSTFANNGFYSIQYRIGSLYFPAFPSIDEARAYADLLASHGRPGNSLEDSGICDANNYYLTTTVNQATGALTGVPADCFLHGYSFDKLKGAMLYGVELDGLNTMSASGAQVVVQIQNAPPTASVVGAVIRYTRILRIKNGAVSVIG